MKLTQTVESSEGITVHFRDDQDWGGRVLFGRDMGIMALQNQMLDVPVALRDEAARELTDYARAIMPAENDLHPGAVSARVFSANLQEAFG